MAPKGRVVRDQVPPPSAHFHQCNLESSLRKHFWGRLFRIPSDLGMVGEEPVESNEE